MTQMKPLAEVFAILDEKNADALRSKLELSIEAFWKNHEGFCGLGDYQIQEEEIRNIFENFPKNDNLTNVIVKVVVLNSFYGTQLEMHNKSKNITELKSAIIQVAQAISGFEGFDEKIKNDNPVNLGLIDDLNNEVKDKIGCNAISFISKYCSFCNPKYPLYDSNVMDVIKFINNRCGYKSVKTDTYKEFYALYNDFKGKFSIESDPKKTDEFLWTVGQIKKIVEQYEKNNKEPHTTYEEMYKKICGDQNK